MLSINIVIKWGRSWEKFICFLDKEAKIQEAIFLDSLLYFNLLWGESFDQKGNFTISNDDFTIIGLR